MSKTWVYTPSRKRSTIKARSIHEKAVRIGMAVIRKQQGK